MEYYFNMESVIDLMIAVFTWTGFSFVAVVLMYWFISIVESSNRSDVKFDSRGRRITHKTTQRTHK